MRLTALEAHRYSLPLDPPFVAAWDPAPRTRLDETIVVVETDEGVRGFAGGAPVPDLDLLRSLLVGCELEDHERLETVFTTVDFHHGRNWSVEVALMDALARAGDRPLWELLGGSRSSFRAYASTGSRLEAGRRAELAREWLERGVQAIKLRFWHDEWRDDLAVATAVREAIGDNMELMIDANHGWRLPGDSTPRWDLATAIECARELSDLDAYWLEEPLDTADVEGYVCLREQSQVRIAGGEMVRSLAETRRLIQGGAFDVVQNDVVLAGGIGGARQVAEWAAEAGIVWSPHTWGTGLGLLANLHAALAWSTAEYIEVPFDPPAVTPGRRDYMLPDPIEIDAAGYVSVPDGPGLGPEPDWAALESFRL